MAKINYANALKGAAVAAAGVVAVDIAGDMLVSKVAYLQQYPAATNAGMLVLGGVVASMGKGKNKMITDSIGLGLVAKGAIGLSNQYIKPMLPGAAPAVGYNYGMYGTTLDETMVAGTETSTTTVLGANGGLGLAG